MTHRLDRISSLPDEVLCHILSFLPTETSVATSILSKRWSPLWRSVPTLHLNDRRTEEQESYLRFAVFVYSFLLFRDATHPIKTCTIKLENDAFFDFNNVKKWLRVILQLGGVEYLDLDFEEIYKLPYNKLPVGILNCRTLVVLKLNTLLVNDVSSVQLPSLKIMHLDELHFEKDGYLSELLSGCPNLEDFKATHVTGYHIHDDRLGEFKSLTKLIRAYFWESHIKFSLELICNVEYLKLDVYARVFSYYKHIPMFCNLTHLELHFHRYYRWKLLLEVLKHCPMLQILVLSEMKNAPEYLDEHEQEEEDWVSPESTPECISSKLRECTISKCEGNKGELQFARYIMRNARVLQIMEIECFCPPGVQFKVKKKISSYKKSSVMCQLLFNF